MKSKHILSLTVLAGLLLFSSCRKDYTCTCTVNDETSVVIFNQEHKSGAESACDEREAAAKLTDNNATCSVAEQ